MKIESTKLKDIKIIEYDSKFDNRGFSYCIYNKNELENAGINFEYIEERIYFSEKAGTIYGIHFQNNPILAPHDKHAPKLGESDLNL
ncbi:dTDP-4-dehydrorhamnose 3,5-epimerase family protein [Clostridium boliviensis]|uniref:dTDP-4-dehydrorhamnose 3,5-epimerase family protein n=1 Tax=Clostridium boliviensis TaxID=318465 RepID=A0ABU4GM09_9CLOT|nr:dTDP-4-dehydrorhamnose 3,5-epimerase family protein [Clostridium boliviensis]MDW2798640.1 dTDP-4-dehydrorhamnose 3,5-epimerase family protein [Clostridium boliviensis]